MAARLIVIAFFLTVGTVLSQTNTNSLPEVLPDGPSETGSFSTIGWIISILSAIAMFFYSLFKNR